MDERAAADPASGAVQGEELLASLGVRRLALPIPFVQAGGPVNAYLIENPDGSLTLFDTGLNTPECTQALLAGVEAGGRRVEEISRVLLSHGHVDHWGLARMVQERSGARVLLHRDDWNKVVAGREPALADGHLERLGLPPELVARVTGMHAKTEAFGRRLDAVEPLEPGARFQFARFEGEILHFPGHTPGLVCLHVPSHQLLFTDDHLLERVSPNPLLEPSEPGKPRTHKALVAYLASAHRLHAMELDWLLPGHGEPFRGHRKKLDSLFAFYARRQGRLAHALEEGPRTAMELVADIFGDAGALQLFLMLSEIVGNLEVLVDSGRVAYDPAEVPFRFRLVR